MGSLRLIISVAQLEEKRPKWIEFILSFSNPTSPNFQVHNLSYFNIPIETQLPNYRRRSKRESNGEPPFFLSFFLVADQPMKMTWHLFLSFFQQPPNDVCCGMNLTPVRHVKCILNYLNICHPPHNNAFLTTKT